MRSMDAFRRAAAVLLLLALSSAAFSCASPSEVQEETTHTRFYFDELPEIEPYQKPDRIRRISDSYLDTFQSGEYGGVVPYAGNCYTYETYASFMGEEQWIRYPRLKYGFCTLDGTVITDPVYVDVKSENGWYIATREPDADGQSRFEFISADGNRVLKPDVAGNSAYPVGGDIFSINPNFADASNAVIVFGDRGTYRCEDGEYANGGDGDTLLLERDIIGTDIYERYTCLLTSDGTVRWKKEGSPVRLDADGFFGFFDDRTRMTGVYDYDGNAVIPAEYEELVGYADGVFYLRRGCEVDSFRTDGTRLRSVTLPLEDPDVTLTLYHAGSGLRFYAWYYPDAVLYDTDGNPTDERSSTEWNTCSYVASYKDGETVLALPGTDIEYRIEGRYALYAESRNGRNFLLNTYNETGNPDGTVRYCAADGSLTHVKMEAFAGSGKRLVYKNVYAGTYIDSLYDVCDFDTMETIVSSVTLETARAYECGDGRCVFLYTKDGVCHTAVVSDDGISDLLVIRYLKD